VSSKRFGSESFCSVYSVYNAHSSEGANANGIRSNSASSVGAMGSSRRGSIPSAKPNAMGDSMDCIRK